jgi:hypothetical protein
MNYIDRAITKYADLVAPIGLEVVRRDAAKRMAKAAKTKCGRGWVMGPNGKCVRPKKKLEEEKNSAKAPKAAIKPDVAGKIRDHLSQRGVDLSKVDPEKIKASLRKHPQLQGLDAGKIDEITAEVVGNPATVRPAKAKQAKKKEAETISAGKPETVRGGHEDYSDYADGKGKKAVGKELAATLGVSQEEGETIAKTVNLWTRTGYKKMRDSQRKGTPTPEAQAMEKFIKGSPKYNGPVFRGLSFKNPKALAGFLDAAGEGIDLDAMSSFSSDEKLAKAFAKGEGGTATSGGVGVLIRVKQNKSGVSVSPFAKSDHKDEFEVVPPKGSKYKAIGTPVKEWRNPSDQSVVDSYNSDPKAFERRIRPSQVAAIAHIVGEDKAIDMYSRARSERGLPEQPRDIARGIINKAAEEKRFTMILDVEEV